MKTNFNGTGPMEAFVKESVTILSALKNALVKVPSGYEGNPPAFNLNEGEDSASFELHMNDALIFRPEKVFVIVNGAQQAPSKYSVKTNDGKLLIRLKNV